MIVVFLQEGGHSSRDSILYRYSHAIIAYGKIMETRTIITAGIIAVTLCTTHFVKFQSLGHHLGRRGCRSPQTRFSQRNQTDTENKQDSRQNLFTRLCAQWAIHSSRRWRMFAGTRFLHRLRLIVTGDDWRRELRAYIGLHE